MPGPRRQRITAYPWRNTVTSSRRPWRPASTPPNRHGQHTSRRDQDPGNPSNDGAWGADPLRPEAPRSVLAGLPLRRKVLEGPQDGPVQLENRPSVTHVCARPCREFHKGIAQVTLNRPFRGTQRPLQTRKLLPNVPRASPQAEHPQLRQFGEAESQLHFRPRPATTRCRRLTLPQRAGTIARPPPTGCTFQILGAVTHFEGTLDHLRPREAINNGSSNSVTLRHHTPR